VTSAEKEAILAGARERKAKDVTARGERLFTFLEQWEKKNLEGMLQCFSKEVRPIKTTLFGTPYVPRCNAPLKVGQEPVLIRRLVDGVGCIG
jgi:hypothetical protein